MEKVLRRKALLVLFGIICYKTRMLNLRSAVCMKRSRRPDFATDLSIQSLQLIFWTLILKRYVTAIGRMHLKSKHDMAAFFDIVKTSGIVIDHLLQASNQCWSYNSTIVYLKKMELTNVLERYSKQEGNTGILWISGMKGNRLL
jgi:hypothetical protein